MKFLTYLTPTILGNITSIFCLTSWLIRKYFRTWSDREIRNLLTKIYELPLSYEIVDHFDGLLSNCSEFQKYPEVETPPNERYLDSKLVFFISIFYPVRCVDYIFLANY